MKKKRISSVVVAKNKHNEFIKSGQNFIKIGQNVFTRENVKNKFSNLTNEEKEKFTVLQLNNLYYLLNSYYTNYILKKSDALRIIDDFIHFDNRADALVKYGL